MRGKLEDSYLDILGILSIWIYLFSRSSELLGSLLTPVCFFVGMAFMFLLFGARYITYMDLFAIAMFIVSGFINIILVGELAANTLFFFIFTFLPLGLYLAKTSLFNVRLWVINIYAIVMYICIHLYMNRGTEFIFYSTSRNYVSVYLVILVFVYSIILKPTKEKIPLWFLILMVVMCTYAVGRAGIIVAFMIFVGVFIIRYFIESKNNTIKNFLKKIFILIGVIIVAYFVVQNAEEIIQTYFGRFVSTSRFGSNIERTAMLTSYFGALKDPQNLLFGVRTVNLSSVLAIDGNIHNSLLMLHARYGIVPVVFIIYRFLYSIILLVRSKEYETALFVFAFFIRSMSDTMFPEFLGDLVLWCIVFFNFKQSEVKRIRVLWGRR